MTPAPAAKPAVNPSDVPAEAPKQLNEAKIASSSDDKPKADATKPDESSSTKTAEAASKDSASSRKAKESWFDARSRTSRPNNVSEPTRATVAFLFISC